MTPNEETRVAQMVDIYETKMDAIIKLCKGVEFEAKTCPEAHLQSTLYKIIETAKA